MLPTITESISTFSTLSILLFPFFAAASGLEGFKVHGSVVVVPELIVRSKSLINLGDVLFKVLLAVPFTSVQTKVAFNAFLPDATIV